MHRIIASLLLSLSLLPALTAQNNRFHPAKQQHAPEQRFSAGLAPFSLLLPSGKVNLKGEFVYADNKSIALLVAVPRPTAVPGFVADNVDVADNGSVTKNTFTTFGAILEQRFYLGHSAPQGFYFAPYARYNNMSVQRTTVNEYATTVKGSIGGFGVGASAGLQVRLGDFVTLDATVVGIDFKWLDGALTYSSDNPDNDLAAFRDKVQEVVNGIPVIGSRLSAQIDGNTVKVRTPGLLAPAYRFNVTLNYVF